MENSQHWKNVIDRIARQNPSLAVNLAKCKLLAVTDCTVSIIIGGKGLTENMIKRNKNLWMLDAELQVEFGKPMAIMKVDQTEMPVPDNRCPTCGAPHNEPKY